MHEKLAEVRTDNDITQRELSKILGWHQVQIARYETGKVTPPINYIIAFCKHFKVSADYILGLPDNLSWPRKQKKGIHPQPVFQAGAAVSL